METVFTLSSLLVVPFWLLMIVAPKWRRTEGLMSSVWSLVPAAALYAVLVLPRITTLLPILSAPELSTVAALLGSADGATIGWVHFLAFDLFVGRWVYLDSRNRRLPALPMAPILFLVFMFGPFGLLAYLGFRSIVGARRGHARESGTSSPAGPAAPVATLFRKAMAVNRPLAIVAAAMIPLLGLTLLGVAIDPREITGAPAWLKPAKFAISISIYGFTLLWLLSRVEKRGRLLSVVATGSAVALGVEWVAIAIQAYRGQASHFNVATPLDGALFSIMGAFVIVIWVLNFVAAGLLLRQRETDAAFGWSLRLGLIIALVGGAMGAAMVRPTPDQMAAINGGGPVTVVGAHSVGVEDGGEGLPVTGWSTAGGDMRVAHFFGLHGLQVLPLLGWLVGRSRRLRPGHRLALVWIGGMGYLAAIGVLFWQALRGESVVAPTPTILAALLTVIGAVTVGAAAVAWSARSGGGSSRTPAAPKIANQTAAIHS